MNSQGLGYLIVAGICGAACTPGAVIDGGADRSPPSLALNASVARDTVRITSVASEANGPILDHRLLLNGSLVREGPVGTHAITDTILPAGTHTVRAEAQSAGGTSEKSWSFVVREILPPRTHERIAFVAEADSVSIDMRTITSGEPDRTYTFEVPAGLRMTRFGSVIRVAATGDATTPWDDFVGSIDLPYTVTDANGSTAGVITYVFTPLPDITITGMVDVVGNPLTGLRPKLSLNLKAHELDVGTRIQGKVGANTWSFWVQSTMRQYVGVVIEGQPEELPLNIDVQSGTMQLTGEDLNVRLVLIPFDLSTSWGDCTGQMEWIYPWILADTTSVVHFIVHTQDRPGRQGIAVGGASHQLWQEAFDSMVADEARQSEFLGRPPRTLIFTTDLERAPISDTTATYPEGRPKAGQVWIFDSVFALPQLAQMFGGRVHLNEGTREMLSATAWAAPGASVGRRRLALARWHDRSYGRSTDAQHCTRHGWPDNLAPLAGARSSWEATVLPEFQRRADQMLRINGKGYLTFGLLPTIIP